MTDTEPQTDTPSTLERLLGETEPVRRALYPMVAAGVALLVFYGQLAAESVPLWLALAVAVLGIGGTEAARQVAYSPATVQGIADEWRAEVEDAHDAPGHHAPDREPLTEPVAVSRANRCREVIAGQRCRLEPHGERVGHRFH